MLYCGIDIAKRKHAVAVLDEKGKLHKPVFSIENTHTGLGFLVDELKGLGSEVIVALEATGHYWLSLYEALSREGYPVSVINPLQIAAFRRSGVRKVKNDRSDAIWVVDFLRISNLPPSSQDIPAQVEMRCLLAQLDLLEEQIRQVEKAQTALMESIAQHITSIPGIGLPTGAAILREIGDVNRFESADKLVAYAGIDAAVHQSGQFQGTEMHMSKRGSPYLRLALWQAASMAIRHNEELKAYYEKKRAEGKAHGTALGAVCRKLLVRIYVVLKENRVYEARPVIEKKGLDS